jgi:putative PIN family toxin of toxin-antitoxin system
MLARHTNNACKLQAYTLSLTMLVTLDTNVIYQALKSATGASFFILQKIRERKIQIALSVPLFEEYQEVLSREKSLNDFELDIEDIDKFLRFIAYVGKPFKTYFLFRPNLKDEKDNMVMELAITSQSDYLVTSNIKDFKNAELKFDQLKIVTPGEFAKIWKSKNV